MNRLKAILEVKEKEVARILPRLEHLRAAALERNEFRPFGSAIDNRPLGLGLIAEVKKASPSAGVIQPNFDPVAIARAYEEAGAHAVSVLTDEQFFQGSLSYLTQIRREISLPVLRKDFIIHEVQIYEAAVAGADAILLIVAALNQDTLVKLHAVAETCQLDVLVEVHSAEELDRALDCGARIIGINNRDLTTFKVSLETTEKLAEDVPNSAILVAESGLKTREDAQRMWNCGCDALLVGEALMRTGDISAQVRDLLSIDPITLDADPA